MINKHSFFRAEKVGYGKTKNELNKKIFTKETLNNYHSFLFSIDVLIMKLYPTVKY